MRNYDTKTKLLSTLIIKSSLAVSRIVFVTNFFYLETIWLSLNFQKNNITFVLVRNNIFMIKVNGATMNGRNGK